MSTDGFSPLKEEKNVTEGVTQKMKTSNDAENSIENLFGS